jgi:hypothetical protein
MRYLNKSYTVRYLGVPIMDRFVRRENVKHYRDLLAHTKSDAERLRIQALLDEEVKKQKAGGDMTLREGSPGSEIQWN